MSQPRRSSRTRNPAQPSQPSQSRSRSGAKQASQPSQPQPVGQSASRKARSRKNSTKEKLDIATVAQSGPSNPIQPQKAEQAASQSGAPTSAQAASSPSRAGSVGELDPAGAECLLEKLNKWFQEMDVEVKHHEGLEDLEELYDRIGNMRSELQELRELQQKKDSAKLLSFSRLSKGDVETRLGVKPYPTHTSSEAFIQVLEQSLEKSEVARDDTQTHLHHQSFLTNYIRLEDHVYPTSEMRTRTVIDTVFAVAVDYLKKHVVPPVFPFIFNEMTLAIKLDSSSISKARHCVIEFEDKATGLSGTTDYLFVSSKNPEKPTLDALSKDDAKTFRDLSKTRYFQESDNCILFELKDQEKRVSMHLPQVIGQAIAALRQNRQRKHISFCLTSGIEWIFGVIFSTGKDTAPYSGYMSPLFNLSLERKDVDGIEHREMSKDYQTILDSLITWAIVPADIITKQFEIEGKKE